MNNENKVPRKRSNKSEKIIDRDFKTLEYILKWFSKMNQFSTFLISEFKVKIFEIQMNFEFNWFQRSEFGGLMYKFLSVFRND